MSRTLRLVSYSQMQEEKLLYGCLEKVVSHGKEVQIRRAAAPADVARLVECICGGGQSRQVANAILGLFRERFSGQVQ